MKDFPIFATQNGIGSLILKEIPYTGKTYIKITDTLEPAAFLEECVAFSKAVGAAEIYASGHVSLVEYPYYTAVWQMSALRDNLPDTDAALFPVTERTAQQWRDIYNAGMRGVPNAAYMDQQALQEMIERADGYFIHRGAHLLGIGMASGSSIATVVSVIRGAGEDIVAALSHALTGDIVTLQVASENVRAVRLYERMGFTRTNELSRWYKIF